MEKYSVIIVAVLSLLGNILSGYFAGNKTKTIIEMRLQALESKVDKHNHLVERTYKLEQCRAVLDERIRNIEEDIDLLKARKE